MEEMLPVVQVAAFRDVITIEVVPAAPAPELRVSGRRVYEGAAGAGAWSEALADELVRAIVGEAVKAMLLQQGRASAGVPRLAVAR